MSTYPPNRLDRQGSANSAIPLSPMTPSGRASPEYDPERAGPHGTTRSGMTHTLKGSARSSSWDLLAGIRKIEHSYEEFDSRNASQPHLAYADGDLPDSKLVKFYNYLLNVSIITRWFLFIIPILAILWIPGILSFTKFPNAKIWGVGLLWWSIWLSVVWGGWWVSLAFARTIPVILRGTLGVVAVGLRRYIDWTTVLHRYVALFVWTLTVWVTWNPLIDNHQDGNTSTKSKNAVDLAAKLFFAFFLCAALLLFEKFSIQWIAGKFHERSYAERIADQKFAVKSLVTLYRHSSDIPGRTDTLHESAHAKNGSVNPKRFFKKLRQGVRMAATTTTTAFGNVASEIAGSSVLQPNSPQSVVKTALESANKSRLLARRLYYSFARPHAEYLLVTDIARFFPSMEEADAVFALFDRDSNGDASRDEVEAALLEFHREQLSIENSMRDLDSAVGRLDNILMSVYAIVAILIVAIALEAQLATVVTGAGTLILGLSWLIGGSLQEVLTSIIFLFVKHPFDVGDKVVITKETYTVKEIRLLSTIFLDSNNTSVQAPNSILNTQFIQNIRRSPQMSETFTFDVAYSTNFEDLEKLRDKMLAFVTAERRDYLPSFDVAVKDFPEQSMMTLTADIKYKSNSQLGAIKAKRRNKWICQLKSALAECKIYGPKGNPDAPAAITKYTQVPYDEVKAKERAEAHAATAMPSAPASTWQLVDQNPASVGMSSGDVFDEADQLYMTSPRRGLPEDPNNQVRFRQTVGQAPTMPAPGPNMPAPGPTGLPRAAASAPTLMPAASVAGPSSPDTIETTPRR